MCCDDVELPKPSGEPMIKAMQEMKSVLTTWYGDAGVQRESDYVVESVDALRNIILGKINYR